MLNGYSNDFVAQDKCKNVALEQIAQGSAVVFQVAGGCGLGVLDAAKEKHVWGIGVDADQSYGPQGSHERAEEGRPRRLRGDPRPGEAQRLRTGGTNLVFNAKNGGVGLGKVSTKCSGFEPEEDAGDCGEVAHGKIIPPTHCAPNPTCCSG